MTDVTKYPGDELELFQHAIRWKSYFSRIITPYINGRVLEAGAGIGSTTLLLNKGIATDWLLLEPDTEMSQTLQEKCSRGELPGNCTVQTGTTATANGSFDTILYIDVLEHIEDDRAELARAAALLNPGGHLIVLSPAFPYLYSPFDKAIGHYRRYTRKRMHEVGPDGVSLIANRYYDSVGFFAALMNKWLLRQKYPSLKQVKFWDRWMVPVSEVTDKLCFHAFGKSIISVWKK
ncbi:MAG: class I SAM-dependent methyltransferase [Bacteroidetes bacterium]|nr:class I SAM-dependent methyltransferase [Bacteroidota bacterium]